MTQNRLKLLEKLVNILLNVLIVVFGIILIISIYTGFQVKILGHKYANFFGYSLFEVQTPSMEPAISSGDWIIVKIGAKPKMNDIITYDNKGDYITHRVREVYNGTYVTQGDANSGKDEPVDEAQVVGTVSKVLGGFGILRKTIFNPAVLIALIITLFLFNSVLKKDGKEAKIVNLVKDKALELINKFKKGNVLVAKKPEVTKVEEVATETPETSEINETEEVEIREIQVEEPKNIILEEELAVTEEDLSKTTELSKTALFRNITVDLAEIEETNLEIAKHEMAEAEKDKKLAEEKADEAMEAEEEIEEPVEESLTKIDLELIKTGAKKNKSTIDAMVNIKKEELNEIASVFDDKIEPNEATIKTTFIQGYIDARYYNYFHERDIKGRNILAKLDRLIKSVANSLKISYRGNDKLYEEKADNYCEIFRVIAKLDQAKDAITETKAKNEYYKNEISELNPTWNAKKCEDAADEIMKIQKSYADVLKYFLKKHETNTFYLDKIKTTAKDIYAVDLGHNLAFSKVYSDYIIDKTYTEGIVAEDKIFVMFTLLMAELIGNMLSTDFEKKYVIYIPGTLYKKEKKLWQLLKTIDDEYAKSHIKILITFKDLKSNRSLIKKVKKRGYKFATVLNDEKELVTKDRSILYMAHNIFIDKKEADFKKIDAFVPKDLGDIVIYDDLTDKISGIEGSEQ